jgi:hypothetical protein
MATATEKMLSHRKKRSGILVPLLEDLFTKPVDIENVNDVAWIQRLAMKTLDREAERKLDSVYGPSSLSSCLRQVYLAKNHKAMGLRRQVSTKIEPNYYFNTGNWLHLKWQFALHKLDQKLPDDVFKLVGTEYRVTSKRKDHAGTLDALVVIYGEHIVVDVKGVNVRTFNNAVNGEASLQYKIQISDYAMLFNVDKKYRFPKVERGIILYENKGGPTNGNPLALHEVVVNASDHIPEIKFRLGKLRQHEKEGTIPKPECKSIRETQFTGCPFRAFCKDEVRQAASDSDTDKRSIAVPEKRRSSRARRDKH